MDEYPETPEAMLARLPVGDREDAQKAYRDWFTRYLDKDAADLTALPNEAFLAGVAYASQWWRD
jgi:hypothetical protein